MKRFCLIITAILFSISCIGCSRDEYPYTIAEYCYCSELDFTLNVTSEVSKLVWHNQQYEVAIGFRAGGYDIFVENGDGAVEQNEILFRGSWSYKRGNLVLEISDDRLFDGTYKELTFEPLNNYLAEA